MEPKLLSSIENDFIRDYSKRIQALQNLEDELKTEQKVYTNIPLDYCVIYKLYNLSVIFHPLSIQYSKVYEKPLWDKVVDTFQKIVEYELTKKPSQLSSTELETAIFHYRNSQTLIK